MDAVDVKKDYLKWLCSLVNAGPEYHFLWYKLNNMAFVWSIEKDENRAEDGKYLRYLFGLEVSDTDNPVEEVEDFLSGPCSVLEFLVGLARRIEDDIMYDADTDDDRTSVWFWEMIRNLGLDFYDDEHYSEVEIDQIIDKFLGRKYSKNGIGNIFRSEKSGQKGWAQNLKDEEIWTQVHLWASQKIKT